MFISVRDPVKWKRLDHRSHAVGRREFERIGNVGSYPKMRQDLQDFSVLIPYSTEQGIWFAEQGILLAEQRIHNSASVIPQGSPCETMTGTGKLRRSKLAGSIGLKHLSGDTIRGGQRERRVTRERHRSRIERHINGEALKPEGRARCRHKGRPLFITVRAGRPDQDHGAASGSPR